MKPCAAFLSSHAVPTVGREIPLRAALLGAVFLGMALPAASRAQATVPAPVLVSSSAPMDLPEEPRPSAISIAPAAPAATYQAADATQKDDELTLRKLPLRFLTDEYKIFTSPARIRKADLRWLLPLAGATGAALATDTHTMREVVSRNPDFNSTAGTVSDDLRYAAVGVPVILFGIGHFSGDDHTREAGMLGGEAVLDAYVFDEIIKYATLRERPAKDNARGKFFTSDAASDPSFISGHSIVAWSSAAVLAAEYPKPWQQGLVYTLATGVSLTRVLGQQHFPSDALVGSAAGWLIGHYVYRAHHRHPR